MLIEFNNTIYNLDNIKFIRKGVGTIGTDTWYLIVFCFIDGSERSESWSTADARNNMYDRIMDYANGKYLENPNIG